MGQPTSTCISLRLQNIPHKSMVPPFSNSQTARPSRCSFSKPLATSASCCSCNFLLRVHHTSLNVVIHLPLFSNLRDVVPKSLRICLLLLTSTRHVLIVTFPFFSTHIGTYVSISFFKVGSTNFKMTLQSCRQITTYMRNINLLCKRTYVPFPLFPSK